MNLAVFGGTGRTGQRFVEQALAAGHPVKVLARTPSKLEIEHASLTIVKGDAAELEAVSRVAAGADAVVSLLGPTTGQKPFTVIKATENILAAMRNHGVKRLIISAGAGVGDPKDKATFMSRFLGFLLKLTARGVYDDMLGAVKAVRESGLDWTIVRAPMLQDGQRTGKIRVGYLGGDVGSRIRRGDLAAFMLEQVDSRNFVHEAPVISN